MLANPTFLTCLNVGTIILLKKYKNTNMRFMFIVFGEITVTIQSGEDVPTHSNLQKKNPNTTNVYLLASSLGRIVMLDI